MLKVIVELHPGGDSELKRTLATMRIGNLSNLATISDYRVTAMEGANPLTGKPLTECVFDVIAHDRRQSVWKLIGAAIRQMEETKC